MRTIITILWVAILSTTVYAAHQERRVLNENEVLTLPSGTKFVLVDDDDDGGIQIVKDRSIINIKKGRSYQIDHRFYVYCEKYDMPGDQASVIISTEPVRTVNVKSRPDIQKPKINKPKSDIQKPKINKPKSDIQKHDIQKPKTEFKPTGPPSSRYDLEKLSLDRPSPIDFNQMIDKAVKDLDNFLCSEDGLRKLTASNAGTRVTDKFRDEYWVVRALYAYRLSQFNPENDRFKEEAMYAMHKIKLDRDVAFRIHKDFWTSGSKTMWDLHIEKGN